MDKTKIVFDVDDTICSNVRRLGYDKCIPDYEVIKKMNHLHDDLGFWIVLHTARGMVSCNGDIDKIIKKNKKVLEDWLARHNVHYDELIFGKPLADLYVDDKALDVVEFKREKFEVMQGGGSGQPIYRLGKIVKKFIGTEVETSRFKDWIEDNKNACKYPMVISYLYNAVYMEFIEGENLSNCLTYSDFCTLLGIVLKFKENKLPYFDLSYHLESLDRNLCEDEEINSMIEVCKRFLKRNYNVLAENASYSHGDLILSNIIKSNDGDLYFIDPRYNRESSSFLFDLAKIRMSLCGYEFEFGISDCDYSGYAYVDDLDLFLKTKGFYNVVIILQLMHVLRLYRYKDEAGKNKVKNIAKGIIESHEELFEWHKEG